MSLTVNAAAALNGAGSFATCRRGGLSPHEVRAIEAARARPRPVPWQALARSYGRPEPEIRALLAPPEEASDAWPLGDCSDAIKAMIRDIAERHGVTVQDIATSRGHRVTMESPSARAQTAAIVAVREQFGLTLYALSFLFLREKSCISDRIREHRQAQAVLS
ncbi:MAG: hypothetical protein ACRED4_06070 [Brevundimonas sp.]